MAETGHTVPFPPGGLIQSDPVITVECSSAEVTPEDVLLKSSDEPSFSSKDLKDSSLNDQHQNKHSCLLTVHREHALSPHKDLNDHSMLSVQRSHTDSLQIFKKATASPLYCETGDAFCQGPDQDVCAQSFPSLVCKQAMPLQQSNTVTTSTRGGGSGSGSPTQPAKNSFIQISEVIPESTCPRFEEAACCNSHFHHGAVEDTFAAYCHPQPIPAPAQLLPHLVGMEENYKGQASASNLLALPRLISSVSETGLDGKRLLRFCNLDCSWPGPLRPVGTQRWVDQKTTREVETMTSQNELRDVGVQVGQDSEEHPQHVFPEVCLDEEKTNVKTVSKSQKSPVKEVKWDAEGMTWEVYGASADPEELGLAIQKHLEIQIKETKGIAVKLSRQNTTASQHSSGLTQRRKKGLLGYLRRPGCCSRTTGAVD
ncbi:GRIN2-like protein [Siphateles boraxobius]|uniref:GRIN2-like protein n=1 Tax=Siphateles boraxobius TaxID=180520 RepID=UPI004063D24F